MECRDFVLQLDDWLDGRLDSARKKSIQEHLGRCPSCRRLYERANAVQAGLRELPPPTLHPDFTDRDRKSTRLNSSHSELSRMPSSA